jgi:hypothetical protein
MLFLNVTPLLGKIVFFYFVFLEGTENLKWSGVFLVLLDDTADARTRPATGEQQDLSCNGIQVRILEACKLEPRVILRVTEREVTAA